LLRWRARARATTDLAGRRADLARAAQLAPDAISVVQDRFDLETGAGDLDAARNIIEQAIARTAPADWRLPALLTLRGILHTRSGDAQAARKAFDAALVSAVSAEQKNEVCWSMATHNAALETALLICNRAQAQAPHDAAILDSRGLVLLRLGRNRDALASYDAALTARHDHVMSLLGRGIARRRLGDVAGGKIDAEAALSIDPGLRQEYAGYGITF
jgi:tetratricopeptide (TPR) repeat protein